MHVWEVIQTYLPEGHNPLITSYYEGRHILRQHIVSLEVSDESYCMGFGSESGGEIEEKRKSLKNFRERVEVGWVKCEDMFVYVRGSQTKKKKIMIMMMMMMLMLMMRKSG